MSDGNKDWMKTPAMQHLKKALTKEAESELALAPLLACPFCGGRFIPEHPKMAEMSPYTSHPKLEELTIGGWRVCCYGCGVQTWDNMKYTREQAIAAWNTRMQANVMNDMNKTKESKAETSSNASVYSVGQKWSNGHSVHTIVEHDIDWCLLRCSRGVIWRKQDELSKLWNHLT